MLLRARTSLFALLRLSPAKSSNPRLRGWKNRLVEVLSMCRITPGFWDSYKRFSGPGRNGMNV